MSAFDFEAEKLGLVRYRAEGSDVANRRERAEYDVVYSINSFRHIKSLEPAPQNIWLALSDGGHWCTLFGASWSSDVGHHLSLPIACGECLFFDGVLGHWEHLRVSRDEIYKKFLESYGEKTHRDAVECGFDHPALNRFCDHDYVSLFKTSALNSAILSRNKRGKAPPEILGATSTRELPDIMK